MGPKLASRTVLPFLAALLFGCSGGGCGLEPPRAGPGPFGMRSAQQIEGGMQLRLTAAGVQRLAAGLAPAIDSALGAVCVPPITYSEGSDCFGTQVTICGHPDCPGGQLGCPIAIRPIPDGLAVDAFSDAGTPGLALALLFDAEVNAKVDFTTSLACISSSASCTLAVTSNHQVDPTRPPLRGTAHIVLSIDPVSGALDATVTDAAIDTTELGATGCAGLGSVVTAFLPDVGAELSRVLTGTLNPVLAAALPVPAGIAGTLDLGQLLGPAVPPDTSLEVLAVLGGWVQAPNGGLSVGVLAGANSDRDPATRTPDASSEPSACVPGFPSTLDLGAAPHALPFNPGRQDYLLSPADQSLGAPEPLLSDGGLADFSLAVSEDLLALHAFHVTSGGLLCFGASDPGFLTLGSLSTLAEVSGSGRDAYQSPLTVALRPTQPLRIQLGSGEAGDPLLQLRLNGVGAALVADGGSAVAPGADVTLGFDLEVIPTASGLALEPLLVAVDVADGGSWQQAIAGAAELLAGSVVTPLPLPSVPGLSAEAVTLQRFDTTQSRFLAIQGAWSASAPARTQTVDAVGAVTSVVAPGLDGLRAAAAGDGDGGVPAVRLALQGDAGPTEWSVRVDRAPWHAWSSDPAPVVTDPLLFLQGHHVIEVRARIRGAPLSTGGQTLRLPVLLDTVPPTLEPGVDPDDGTQIAFNARDFVSPPEAMQYAWKAGDRSNPFTAARTVAVADALAATSQGKLALVLMARDEAGNIGQASFDVSSLTGTKTGCGCTNTSGAELGPGLALLLLGLRRPRRGRSAPPPPSAGGPERP